MKKEKETWSEEFDKKMDGEWWDRIFIKHLEVKDFIRQLLKLQKEEILEKLDKEFRDILIEGFATSPSRCWHNERGTKDEIEAKRIENFNHINSLIEEFKNKLNEIFYASQKN